MGVMDFIKGELIEVVEWTDDTAGQTIVYRFPTADKEIMDGAQLTVRESQVAIMVNEGVLADVFLPGRYELTTSNMPILTTLSSWKYGFNSPFKTDIYFVSTRQFLNQKWGTSNPVTMRDKDFGVIRVRGFGVYSFKVDDAAKFLKEVFGTCSTYETSAITGHLKAGMIGSLSDLLAESGVPLLDMSTQYDELSEQGSNKFEKLFTGFGLKLVSFFIQNISLPEEVEKMIDTKTKMGVLGDMNQYTKFKAAESLEKAAENPGNNMVGMGVGIGAAGMMSKMFVDSTSGAGNETVKVVCPSCGAKVNEDTKFCPKCGKKVKITKVPCISCGTSIKKGAKFCPECGSKQKKVKCAKCGFELAPGAKFCPECGEKN